VVEYDIYVDPILNAIYCVKGIMCPWSERFDEMGIIWQTDFDLLVQLDLIEFLTEFCMYIALLLRLTLSFPDNSEAQILNFEFLIEFWTWLNSWLEAFIGEDIAIGNFACTVTGNRVKYFGYCHCLFDLCIDSNKKITLAVTSS